MQTVKHQKAAYKLIVREGLNKHGAGVAAGTGYDLENTLEAGAVKLHERLDQIPSGSSQGGIGRVFELLDQPIDSSNLLLEFLCVIACANDYQTSANARFQALCRCPDTCERRTAGTDRNCGPRA